MRFRKQSLWIPLLAVAFCLTGSSFAAEEGWDAPEKKWSKGPVSYLFAGEESKEYKKRKGAEERAAFIDEFWELRNPRPGEQPNPFRDRFYQRVASVDETLKQQGIPAGWKSALGRVLILLGQPDRFQRQAPEASAAPDQPSAGPLPGGGDQPPASPAAAEAGMRLTLTYNDLTRLGLPANLELHFQQEGMSFVLLTRVDLATDAVLGLDTDLLAELFPAGAVPAPEEVISLAPTEPEPAAQPAAGVGHPVRTQMLLDALAMGELMEAIPFVSAVDLYKAKARKTYVAISVGIDPAAYAEHGESGLHPLAALQDQSDPENLYLYDTDSLFAPAEENAQAGEGGLLRFQAGDGVDPGTYTLVIGWSNEDGTVAGLRRRDLEVPDFSTDSIQLSSVALVDSWDNVEEAPGDLKRPYILGNRRVLPKVDPSYPRGGNLALYYQVYNAADEGQDPNLRIAYHVYQKRGTRWSRTTVPPVDGVKELVQIYELSLEGWPSGEFKIKVTVTDNRNGAFQSREVHFQIR
jgi:GWxTD domain-containing protein